MAITEERIVEEWNKRMTAARELRQIPEQRWFRNGRAYRNAIPPRRFKNLKWQYAEPLPDVFRVTETMSAHQAMAISRDMAWYGWEAPSAEDIDYTIKCKALTDRGWRGMDGFRKTSKAVRSATIFGHVIGKLYWQTRLGERQVMEFGNEIGPSGELLPVQRRITVPTIEHDGPQLEHVNLFNVYQDPTGNEEWWIQRIPSSISKLVQVNKDYGGVLYKNLNKLTNDTALRSDRYNRVGQALGIESFHELAQAIDGLPETSQLADDHVELWQCWGYVPKDVRSYEDVLDENGQVVSKATQWRLQIIANTTTVIRDEPAPTFDHRPPFFNVPLIPLEDQIYGDTPVSYIHKLSEMRSQIESNRINAMMLEMFGTNVLHMDAEVDGRMSKEPGGYLRVRPPWGMSLSDVWSTVPRHPMLNDAYVESEAIKRHIEDTAGAQPPFQGAFAPGGSHRTGMEWQGTVELGAARMRNTTMWWDESWLGPIMERMFKYYQTRLTTPQILRIIGSKGNEESVQIDFRQLVYDVDVWVNTSLNGSMDQQQLMAIRELLAIIAPVPEWRVNIDPRKLVRNVSYRAGATGMDDILRSKDEVVAILKQEAAVAAAQGNVQGAGAQ